MNPTPARTRRHHRQHRDAAVAARFHQLYQQQRLRLDDVVAQLAGEFFLTPRTVLRILKQRPGGEPTTAPTSAPAATPTALKPPTLTPTPTP